MPASSALSVGPLNALLSTSATAMPSALELMALFIALTICPTLLLSDPVHWYEQPSSLQASSAPYFVGTKNGFVVTWLTNTNLYFFGAANTSVPLLWAVLVAGVLPSPPHAAMAVLTRAAAPPVSAARRVKPRSRECGVG